METFLTWQTEINTYDDGSVKNFFLGQVEVKKLQVWDMFAADNHKKDDIRVTIGIKNPQDDAYDLMGIDILYDRDTSEIVYLCEDGYANGTISTRDHFGNSPRGRNYDQHGYHNITISEWTRYKLPKDDTVYRAPEVNDCEVISGTATERNDNQDARAVTQDFTVKFRKPMET